MAQEAGLVYRYPFTWANLEDFAALVAAAEREACIRVCDEIQLFGVDECIDAYPSEG